ncbi:hypothetical protein [Nocardiopsis sp. FR4]|uniref:hypothetical protein n=1 Tax=Nocardiopsis sp. FR4 TaxID=2605985 RepID=UPI0013576469|nr:hypothetical protein [Nocardiopsis sp. FR4]
MDPIAEYSSLITSEYHLFQVYDPEAGLPHEARDADESPKRSEDGVISVYGRNMVEIIQAEETFRAKVELRVWEGQPAVDSEDSTPDLPFRISVPSKELVLDSVAGGAQAAWTLPAGGEYDGRVSHTGRESARSLAARIWEELDDDYTFEHKRRLTRPLDGTEKYTIDLWPAVPTPP